MRGFERSRQVVPHQMGFLLIFLSIYRIETNSQIYQCDCYNHNYHAICLLKTTL